MTIRRQRLAQAAGDTRPLPSVPDTSPLSTFEPLATYDVPDGQFIEYGGFLRRKRGDIFDENFGVGGVIFLDGDSWRDLWHAARGVDCSNSCNRRVSVEVCVVSSKAKESTDMMQRALAISLLMLGFNVGAQTVGQRVEIPAQHTIFVDRTPQRVFRVPGGELIEYAAQPGQPTLRIRRYANGTFDQSFAGTGYVDGGVNFVYPDGRFMAGSTRYLANGFPDPSFNFAQISRQSTSMVTLLPDGRIGSLTTHDQEFSLPPIAINGNGFNGLRNPDGSIAYVGGGAHAPAAEGGFWLLMGNQLSRVTAAQTAQIATLDVASVSRRYLNLRELDSKTLALDVAISAPLSTYALRRYYIDMQTGAQRSADGPVLGSHLVYDSVGTVWSARQIYGAGMDGSAPQMRLVSAKSDGTTEETPLNDANCASSLDADADGQVWGRSNTGWCRLSNRQFVPAERFSQPVFRQPNTIRFAWRAIDSRALRLLARSPESPALFEHNRETDATTQLPLTLVQGEDKLAISDQSSATWHIVFSTPGSSGGLYHQEFGREFLGAPTQIATTSAGAREIRQTAADQLWIRLTGSTVLLERRPGSWSVVANRASASRLTAPTAQSLELRGRSCDEGIRGPAVIQRFRLDNAPDTSYGAGGSVTLRAPGYRESCIEALNTDTSNRVYASLNSLKANADGVFVRHIVRLLPDGSVDPSWGVDGYALVGATGAPSDTSLLPHRDGLLVQMGTYKNLRLTANGQHDKTFSRLSAALWPCTYLSETHCHAVGEVWSLSGVPQPAATGRADFDLDGVSDYEELLRGTDWLRGDADVWGDPQLAVRQLYRDLLLREADAGGEAFSIDRLRAIGFERFTLEILESPEYEAKIGAVVRMYKLALGRAPDGEGLLFWSSNSWKAQNEFVVAPEFLARYGQLDDSGLIDRFYLNALGRAATPEERTFWLRWMQQRPPGQARGDLLYEFAIAPEYRGRVDNETFVQVAFALFLKRSPDPGGLAYWQSRLAQGMPREELIAAIRATEEYRLRFVW